ncbi:MAG: zinc-dependent alcohol dehydrogenase family protein [Pseudomonadota bacterium]
MRAMLMTTAGGPEVLRLEDIPEPKLQRSTQVKVRLRAAGVNPLDTKLRSRGVFYPDALPAILGCDGAGEVIEAGDASGLRVGDRVAFCHGGLGAAPGNYAEMTVIEAAETASIPPSVSFEQAAALPLVLITAWESLIDRARIQAGQTVLILGGAGGVGHIAIQLAKQRGLRVLATVGSEEKAAFVRSLGADKAIQYDKENLVEAVMRHTGGRGADVVFDTVGGALFAQAVACAAYAGDLVTLLEPLTDAPWKEARNRNLRIGFDLMLTPMLRELPEARAHQVEILCQGFGMLADGRLRVQVGGVFPLEEAAEAHRRLASGHTQGKLVLAIG